MKAVSTYSRIKYGILFEFWSITSVVVNQYLIMLRIPNEDKSKRQSYSNQGSNFYINFRPWNKNCQFNNNYHLLRRKYPTKQSQKCARLEFGRKLMQKLLPWFESILDVSIRKFSFGLVNCTLILFYLIFPSVQSSTHNKLCKYANRGVWRTVCESVDTANRIFWFWKRAQFFSQLNAFVWQNEVVFIIG